MIVCRKRLNGRNKIPIWIINLRFSTNSMLFPRNNCNLLPFDADFLRLTRIFVNWREFSQIDENFHKLTWIFADWREFLQIDGFFCWLMLKNPNWWIFSQIDANFPKLTTFFAGWRDFKIRNRFVSFTHHLIFSFGGQIKYEWRTPSQNG